MSPRASTPASPKRLSMAEVDGQPYSPAQRLPSPGAVELKASTSTAFATPPVGAISLHPAAASLPAASPEQGAVCKDVALTDAAPSPPSSTHRGSFHSARLASRSSSNVFNTPKGLRSATYVAPATDLLLPKRLVEWMAGFADGGEGALWSAAKHKPTARLLQLAIAHDGEPSLCGLPGPAFK